MRKYQFLFCIFISFLFAGCDWFSQPIPKCRCIVNLIVTNNTLDVVTIYGRKLETYFSDTHETFPAEADLREYGVVSPQSTAQLPIISGYNYELTCIAISNTWQYDHIFVDFSKNYSIFLDFAPTPPPLNPLNEKQILYASDKDKPDQFGRSVSIAGNFAIIGAPYENGGIGNPLIACGAAYIFERNGSGVWEEKQILHASDRQNQDKFGYTVAVSGLYAVVTSFAESSLAGAVYIFERNGSGVWEEKQILHASDRQKNDYYGCSIAITGIYLVIGAYGEDGGSGDPALNSGAAYIYERNGSGVWEEKQILHANDRQSEDKFGFSVAITETYLVIGAYGEDGGSGDPALNSGAAYIYERNGSGVWEEKQILHASNLQNDDCFGYSAAMDNDYAIIGATKEDGITNTITDSGAVYIFERNGSGVWEEKQILHGSAGQSSDNFGFALTIKNYYVIVGCNDKFPYLFQLSDGVWSETNNLISSSINEESDWYGNSVFFDGSSIIIGAYGKDLEGYPDTAAGAAYIFD